MNRTGPKIRDLIRMISETLLGSLLVNSRSGLQPVYSEYLLYEPILRCAVRKWNVESEYPVEKVNGGRGDYKRIDFVFTNSKNENRCAVEVKYVKKKRITSLNIQEDINKLHWYLDNFPGSEAYLIVAGKICDELQKKLVEQGTSFIIDQFDAQRRTYKVLSIKIENA